MIIRKGNLNDVAEIRRLFADTITEVCKNDYSSDQINVWKSGAENEERWLKVIEKQIVLIAEINGKTVGFCTLDQGNYIDLLFVHHDFQQQGIARKLYVLIEQEARNQGKKGLSADVSRTARSFFEKMGFTIIQEQTVNVKGTDLINYKMEKKIV
ncbi:hypothetical protein ACM46_07200 [Chryseobacterium angstadtii]|uniref:N-acetyltransferase domain-containing protein n=1 Tax=Chryseobacterium angstadtii TaxID=558151 RepID=A0A0J7IGX6_9FLAO|nr:GNAT family N-acetyltransferase [Chryseobacterium angstadtii]KMQ65653.1 hypothetical protein ACM46_07200 [Chryseobacterium angstadtii]